MLVDVTIALVSDVATVALRLDGRLITGYKVGDMVVERLVVELSVTTGRRLDVENTESDAEMGRGMVVLISPNNVDGRLVPETIVPVDAVVEFAAVVVFNVMVLIFCRLESKN